MLDNHPTQTPLCSGVGLHLIQILAIPLFRFNLTSRSGANLEESVSFQRLSKGKTNEQRRA